LRKITKSVNPPLLSDRPAPGARAEQRVNAVYLITILLQATGRKKHEGKPIPTNHGPHRTSPHHELLLGLDHPEQALKEFETSRQPEPNRFHGVYGPARAAKPSGDRDKARTDYPSFMGLCAQVDSDRPELMHVKAFLAQR
jgi:hypothetical protein